MIRKRSLTWALAATIVFCIFGLIGPKISEAVEEMEAQGW